MVYLKIKINALFSICPKIVNILSWFKSPVEFEWRKHKVQQL